MHSILIQKEHAEAQKKYPPLVITRDGWLTFCNRRKLQLLKASFCLRVSLGIVPPCRVANPRIVIPALKYCMLTKDTMIYTLHTKYSATK